MKRFILSIFALLAVSNIYAQENSSLNPDPFKVTLANFQCIDVDAPIKLTLIKIGSNETPYIIYDTHGCYTSKFEFEVVSKNGGTLKIEERNDPKRTSITEVEVYFNELTDISISKADTTVKGTLTSQLLDLYISNDSHFIADVDTLDIKVFASGKCCIILTGSARYQTVDISTAEYDASKLETVSTVAASAHNANVKVNATERLEAQSSTGGKILYAVEPIILRSEITLFGGEIRLD